jgi:diguanylate cyclase (GGDEF)-like protein
LAAPTPLNGNAFCGRWIGSNMTTTSIAIETVEQASRWLNILLEAQQAGHWREFDKQHRAFVGFCKVLASDSGAVRVLSEIIRSSEFALQLQEVLNAVDQLTSGVPEGGASHVALFSPPLDDLEGRAIQLAAYVRNATTILDPLLHENGTVVERSLQLRGQIESLLSTSTDFDNPGIEAFCVYTFGVLLVNTPPSIYRILLRNSNHIPFQFEILIASGEAILNILRARQAKQAPGALRTKGEKFGILDSPKLLSQDLASTLGALGTACIYIDIDNFKSLNTKYSERIVDRDILPAFQRLVSSAVDGIGFAYAEGGDEVTVLLPNATADIAVAWCAGLRSILHGRLFQIGETQLQLTVSVGVSHAETGGNRGVLPEHANLAMRKAKELGKNRVCLHSQDGPKDLSLSRRGA